MKGGKIFRMRKTHSFEIVGVGTFEEYPAKVKEVEYPCVSKEGLALAKKVLTQGNSSVYGWIDVNGKTYSKEEVFYNVNGLLGQKFNKTEKVKKVDIVGVGEAIELLESDTSFLLPQNETTLDNFRKMVGEGKALKFNYKKSSVGLKWVNAFVFELKGELVMITGLGNRTKALEQFKESKKAQSKSKSVMPDVVEISADEVSPTID